MLVFSFINDIYIKSDQSGGNGIAYSQTWIELRGLPTILINPSINKNTS